MLTMKPVSMVLSVVLVAGAVVAGPLNPAAGPVGSTMKPINEVETRTAVNATNTPGDAGAVFIISQPGSYYLSGNVSVGASKVGVQINASDVTLDLNGFTINGQTGSVHGVWVGGGGGRVTVKNGTVATMGADGVHVTATGVNGGFYRVEDLLVVSCGDEGIEMLEGTVKGCVVRGCMGYGVYMTGFSASMIESTVMSGNGGGGLKMLDGVVRGCTAKENGDAGISVGYATITDCVSIGNGVGYSMDRGLISGCSAVENSQVGIRVGGGTVVLNNTVSADALVANSIGIRVQNIDGARIEGNSIVRQATGVSCGTSNNLIIKNSFRGCTNAVSLVANNRLGPLFSATAQPAITGNSGGGLGATDPNANMIH